MPDLDTNPTSLHSIFDPTSRTLNAVEREISALEDKIQVAMDYRGQLFEAQFVAIDNRDRVREAHRLELKDMADKSRLEQKEDSKVSVDAALTAQKEAVKEATIATNLANAKSEAAMTKALDQVSQTFSIAIANALSQIIDVKENVNGIDYFRRGSIDSHTEKRLNSSLVVAIISIIGSTFFSSIAMGLTLFLRLKK